MKNLSFEFTLVFHTFFVQKLSERGSANKHTILRSCNKEHVIEI